MIAFFAENPWQGLGAVVGVKIGEQIAAAGIGKLLEKALGTVAGGSTIAVAAAAIIIEQAIVKMIEDKEGRITGGVEGESKASNERRELEGKIKDGTATPADIERARKVAGEVGKTVQTEKDGLDPGKRGVLEGGFRSVVEFASPNVVAADEKNQRETMNATVVSLEKLNAAIDHSAKALWLHGKVGDKDKDGPHRNEPQSSPKRGGAG